MRSICMGYEWKRCEEALTRQLGFAQVQNVSCMEFADLHAAKHLADKSDINFS